MKREDPVDGMPECIRLIDRDGRVSLGLESSKVLLFFALLDGARLGYESKEIDCGGVRIQMDPKATALLAKAMRADDWNGRRDRQMVSLAQYCVDESWARLESLLQARDLDRCTAPAQLKVKKPSRM